MPTILVVDDDQTVQDVIVEALTEEGFRVIAAPNGRAALEKLGSVDIDLILLDYNMPVMDGPEFARVYRASRVHPAPIVLITANGRARAAALEIGAQGFISKPFEIDHLIDVAQQYALTAV